MSEFSRITDQTISTAGINNLATRFVSEDSFWSTQQVSTLFQTSSFTPIQTTTIRAPSGESYVSDVNLSAYMRQIDIDIICYNMRPNRKIYVFFDGKDVTKLIQQTNVIETDNDRDFVDLLPRTRNVDVNNIDSNGNIIGPVNTIQEEITVGGGRARVLYSKRIPGGRRLLYISEIVNANSSVDWANGTVAVVSTRTGARANVVSQSHISGFLKKAGKIIDRTFNNRIWRLDLPFLRSNNDIEGKTITILNGRNPGESAQILSFNRANGEIVLSKSFEGFTPNTNIVYTIGNIDPTVNANNTSTINNEEIFFDIGKPDDVLVAGRSSSDLFTDENGIFVGTLRIPDPNISRDYRFTVGEKLLRISDSPTNNPSNATTIAEYNFVAFGLNISRSQIIINSPRQEIRPVAPPILPPSSNTVPSSRVREPFRVNRPDPIAQSFFVSELEYPRGFFVPYIDLFFANKGTLPVEVQIRPLVNGFPSSTDILPNATAYMSSEDVKVSEIPNPSDSSTYTRFTFASPVYLQPGLEYAIVVLTNDFDYDIYVSELGEKIINSDRIVSTQPYLGSLFKSQNATTYTPIQSEDLMFVIHKCVFSTAGSVQFNEYKVDNYVPPSSLNEHNTKISVDAFEIHSDIVELNGSKINYFYKAKSNVSNQLDTTFNQIRPESRIILDERKIILGPNDEEKSFLMKMELVTDTPDISPIIYSNKQSISTVQTIINDMGIDGYRIEVANTGNNYTYQNTSITFTSNTGQGANAVALTKIEPIKTGKIAGLLFDSNGFGYYDDVSVNVTSSDGSGAVINVLSETGKSGGPAAARYISKTVTLSPEFDAGDLRVYLTAVVPREANIEVYYKVKNNFDIESISDKRWVRMEKVPGIKTFSTKLEAIEFEYRPSLTSNNIVYSTDVATFDTFNQFKIKIVLASSDTVLTKIPYVYDMRAIALPGDE